MTGPANALQPAGHRWWCLYLDHQIDRAHVDAQLQAGRRHHRFELPAFEVLFDNGALLLADRAMVGAGQHRRRSNVWPEPMMCAGAPPATCWLVSGASSIRSARREFR